MKEEMESQGVQVAARVHRIEAEYQLRQERMDKELRESMEAISAAVALSRAEPREPNRSAKAEFHSPRSDPGYSPNPIAVYNKMFGKATSPAIPPFSGVIPAKVGGSGDI